MALLDGFGPSKDTLCCGTYRRLLEVICNFLFVFVLEAPAVRRQKGRQKTGGTEFMRLYDTRSMHGWCLELFVVLERQKRRKGRWRSCYEVADGILHVRTQLETFFRL